MTENIITENYQSVLDDIAKTLKYINEPDKKVNLIAVSKTMAAERILPLLLTGHRLFGENRVQEAKEKWLPLKERFPNVELHMIGPLQRNKVKDAVRIFDVIETVASLPLAEDLRNECEKQGKNPRFFVQVNTGEEEQKSGLRPRELDSFLEQCPLAVSGLMCIPPIDEEPSVHFHMLAVMAKRHNLKHLSMGMSSDYREAVMLGADYIRVGSKIFGERHR